MMRCPKCGVEDIAEIVYEQVEMTAEVLQKIQAHKLIIRLNPEGDRQPKYHCNYCKYEW